MSSEPDLQGVQPDTAQYRDPHFGTQFGDFAESEFYRRWHQQIIQSDNDFITVIAASSKSAISGTGKTTLALTLARWFDQSGEGFNAGDKATLNATEFARDMLADPDQVPDKSALIFDEGQGTLESDGADARRSMAGSVMDVTTALSTMRFRQLSPIIVTQSTKWIDKRVSDILDALVLVQPRRGNSITARIYETYYNDFKRNSPEYTELMDICTWEAIPKSDADYRHLGKLKQQSAKSSLSDGEDEADNDELTKEQQKKLAQHLRDTGHTVREVADSPLISYGRNWVSEHTEGGQNE